MAKRMNMKEVARATISKLSAKAWCVSLDQVAKIVMPIDRKKTGLVKANLFMLADISSKYI